MDSLVAKHFPPSRLGKAGANIAGWRRWGGVLTLLGLLIAVAGLCTLATYSSRRLNETLAEAPEEEPVYLPDVRFLRLASLGYHNALADVLWFRTINYFGKHFRGDRLYPWLARMCDAVTDLDPRAAHVYSFAGFILTWEAQMPDEGIRMLQKGVTQFPESWELHYYLGFSRFYFKDDMDGALPELRRASELPGTHPYVTRLAAMLYTQQYGTEMAREFLEQLRESGAAGGMEKVVDERLKDVELSEHVALIEDGVRRYRERFGHDPADLQELVGTGILSGLPKEPFGYAYTYDPTTKQAHSTSGRRALRTFDSVRRQQVRSGQNFRD